MNLIKNKATTAAVAAALAGGMAIGSFVAPPMAAFAADTSTSTTATATARTPGQWMTDALKGLVTNGTLTQAQSDTVASTLSAAEPKGRHGGGPGGPNVTEAAKVLNLGEADLRTQMKTKSLADIAKAQNVDVQKVIDALVAAQNARIDKQVTDGKLTQAEADTKKTETVTKVTDSVNKVQVAPEGKGKKPAATPPTTAAPAA